MSKTGKRMILGRGKGYLSAAGPQSRFILFLLIILGVYTFLLKVFQKLAEIVQLPVFLPIALVTLLFFIGIAGTMYSHTFTGPIVRIRRVLQQIAQGDTNVSLRLREADDPMLKDLVSAIRELCDCSRSTNALIHETVQDIVRDITVLQEQIRDGANPGDIQGQLDSIQKKKDVLQQALSTHGK